MSRGRIRDPLELVFSLVAVALSGRAEHSSTSLSLSQTPRCSITFLLPLISLPQG